MADDFARQLLDALYNPETQPPQQPSRPLREKLAGAAETAATLGSGLLASVPAGLAGLSQMIPTRGHRPSVNRAAQKVEDVQSALTYLPRTEAGQEYLEKTAGALGVLGMPAEFLGEQTLKLTGSPFLATTANVALDPVNYIGMPGSGRAIVAGTKAVGRGAMQAGRAMAQDPAVGAAVERAIQRVAPAAMPMYAVKPKGGNWLAGEVEGATEPLRQKGAVGSSPEEMLAQMRERYTPEVIAALEPPLQESVARSFKTLDGMFAINNWIDKKLNRYIRNEMATPEDPVRKLAEQGILHYEPRVTDFLSGYAQARRRGEGEQLGLSPLAKVWEDISDSSILPSEAVDFQSGSSKFIKQQNPWIDKVPPETKIYTAASSGIQDLGFDHLIDELKNAVRPDSDLPAHLRWKPEDLEKVTMEQAVRRVHDINEYRAQKKAEANEVLARNPATVTFKEYPTVPGSDKPNEKGLAWKEIKAPDMPAQLPEGWTMLEPKGDLIRASSPDGATVIGDDIPDLIKNIYKRHPETPGNPRTALQDALKYEGDVMGHCVGGYCDDVLSGRTQIYSLRDKKGEPHVTIEVGKPDYLPRWESVVQYLDQAKEQVIKDRTARGLDVSNEKQIEDLTQLLASQMAKENAPLEIKQIKGSGKKDRSQRLRIKETGYKDEPDAYLLPFIQDFVRSGNWSLVNDIQNTGLITPDRVLSSETRRRLEAQGVQIPKYMTEQEAKELSKQAIRASDIPTLDQSAGGMKRGGSVHISDNPDTMQLELAAGGAVAAAKAAAKAAEKAVPPKLPRAEPKTKAEIEAIAQRMAPQLTGEYVRKSPESAITVAGKTKRQFEREKELPVKLTGEERTPEQVGIESMKDKVAIGILGDPSITGRELESVGDIRLGLSSPQHGGPLYGMGRDEEFWASGKGAAQKVQNLAEEAGKQYDTDVLGKYIMMGPEGLNYALHFADANLQAIDTSKMTKRQIEEFNKLIRKGSPDSGPRPSFPGIEDKVDAYLQFAIDPKLRIHFNSLMQMPTVTEAFNLPSGQDIRFAITEPSLRDLERGVAGMSIGQMRPGAELTQSLHPTYEMDIPGKFMGSSKYPIPYELMFPDTVKAIRSNPKQAPHEFGSLGMVGPRQIIDQQMIDELKAYEEQIRKLTGKKEGGAVEMASGGGVGEKRDLASKIAGGGIRGVITRGLLGMDPPEDMTPREREIYENAARASAPAQGLGVGKAIFIGANAKTWNKAAAARAVELEKAGVSPEQIWRETGTFRGADGKLRQEISDVGAVHRNPKELQELGKAKKEEARELQLRLVGTPGQKDLFPKALTEAKRPVREQVKQLKEEAFKLMLPSDTRGQSARFALEHPELYKAYPELGDIPVYQGVYGSGRELGSLRGVAGDLEMSVTQSGLRKGPRSTMLHEMQHAVQSLEGMSPGGSSTMAFQDPKAFEILKQLREEVRKPPSFEEFQRLNKYPESEAQNAYAQFLKEREANPILHPAIERSLQERAANEYYKRLAGEAEARATQYREGMGPTQRRQEFPYSSYDVLPDDLIVKPPRTGLPGAAESASEIPADIAARMAAQRAELVLRSRAMQELKDQFENLPQPPKGFLSPENILQRMDEIRRREATPPNGQIPLLKKGGGVEMQAGGALKAAAKAAAKAAETTKKVSTNAAPLTPLQSIQQGGYKIPPGGLSSEDKAALRPLYNQGLVKVEERGQEKFIVPGRGAWFEFATPEQKKALDQFQVAQNLKDLSFMGPTESLLNSAQASFYDFEISPGVRSIPIKMFEPFIGGYDSAHESKRIQDLTRAIQQSKQIEPLFVGLDPTGEPYIMEGQHRVRALKALGYDQIPARVVVDMDDITKAKGGAVSKRGSVKFTDNLDTMRLAVQKRK